jgi:hypothetical protein
MSLNMVCNRVGEGAWMWTEDEDMKRAKNKANSATDLGPFGLLAFRVLK